MPFPKEADIQIQLLQALLDSGGSAEPQTVYPKVAACFPDLTPEEQEQRLESTPTTKKWWNLVQWARQQLVQNGEIDGSTRGVWKLTDAGRARLSKSVGGMAPGASRRTGLPSGLQDERGHPLNEPERRRNTDRI